MTLDLVLALFVFAFVGSVTPGPNNLMLLASGVNYGLRRTLPHIAGVSLGVAAMVLVLGAGLARVFATAPRLEIALKIAAVIYMLWLAWKIATAAPSDQVDATGRPLTFLQALGFQWVNPKAWAMALTALGAYALGDGLAGVLVVALVFVAVGPPSNILWVVMGQGLRRLLAKPVLVRRFNVSMALLLVASLWPVLRA
jgi:threonine/homoserine/homoserine lactone efflux protein